MGMVRDALYSENHSYFHQLIGNILLCKKHTWKNHAN